MIKILLLFKKIHSTMPFLKSQLNPFPLQAKMLKLIHALQVVTVKVLPPPVSRLYLREVRLKLQYLVCLLWMLL